MKSPLRLALKFLLGASLASAAAIALIGLLLMRGIQLDQLNVANLELEALQLKLDQKLQLDVRRVTVAASDTGDKSTLQHVERPEPSHLKHLLSGIKYLKKLFSIVDIHRIEVANMTAQFHYRRDGGGKLAAQGPGADVLVLLDSEDESLLLEIKHLRLEAQGLELGGTARIDTVAVLLEAQLDVRLAATLALDIQLQADTERLSFQASSDEPVADIAPVVRLFKLGPAIDPWIIDYLDAREFKLTTLAGTLPYDEPAQLLQTLEAEAWVEGTRYTFAEGLEPVLAAQTRVVFQRGVLLIEPRDATFYGQDTGTTYVDIDFNADPVILSIVVRTRAQASGGVLDLLEYYGIPLPVHQVQGLTDVDLTLRIDLSTGQLESNGRFSAGETVLAVGGQQLDVDGLDIALERTRLDFKQLNVSMGGLMSVSIIGTLDLGSDVGELKIDVNKFHWQGADSELTLLQSSERPLKLTYHFGAAGDRIDIPASNWLYGDMAIAVESFSTPFDLGSVSGSLDKVGVTSDSGLNARISGEYQSSLPYARLTIALRSLPTDALTLRQATDTSIALVVGSEVTAASSAPVHLLVAGNDITVQPTSVRYSNNELTITKSGFAIEQGITAGLQGRVNFASGAGKLLLHNLLVRNSTGSTWFNAERSIGLTVASQGENLRIGIPRLGAVVARSGSGSWSADIEDISRLYTLSPLLQQLQISRGALHVSSATGGAPYQIRGHLRFPLSLLMGPDHRRITEYRFSGSYAAGQGQLDINRKVKVKWGDKIDIETKDVGYSIAALGDILDALTGPGAATEKPLGKPKGQNATAETATVVNLHGRNSFIALDELRRTPVDEFFATFKNGKTSARFYYGEGISVLDYADGHFSFGGKDLDISVLTNFVTLADFEGGTVEFLAEGDRDELHGALRIQNTIIKDYKHLNNMLAFINTLPGLLTFNPPNYHSQGLPAREAYLEAVYKHGVLDLKSMVIDSDELNIRGTGIIDLNRNTTDMTFNLVSGLRKSLGRIPVVGYLLVGDDKQPTLTLKVSGDLQNPKVSNSAAQDLVSYPWQLIQNTIKLPGHLSTQLQSYK